MKPRYTATIEYVEVDGMLSLGNFSSKEDANEAVSSYTKKHGKPNLVLIEPITRAYCACADQWTSGLGCQC